MLRENIIRRLKAVIVLLQHVDTPGISNEAKSSYYRSAIIIESTIVEGLVYELVKKHTMSSGNVLYQKS